jgi:hypothetical protein
LYQLQDFIIKGNERDFSSVDVKIWQGPHRQQKKMEGCVVIRKELGRDVGM